jgi:hypothetical protein
MERGQNISMTVQSKKIKCFKIYSELNLMSIFRVMHLEEGGFNGA